MNYAFFKMLQEKANIVSNIVKGSGWGFSLGKWRVVLFVAKVD